MDIQLKGISHISFHLMNIYCELRGLEQVMWDMHDNPGMLHEAMHFLEEGHRQLVQQYYEFNLFSLNNDETYHSSGGVGYTDELPKPDYNPEKFVHVICGLLQNHRRWLRCHHNNIMNSLCSTKTPSGTFWPQRLWVL